MDCMILYFKLGKIFMAFTMAWFGNKTTWSHLCTWNRLCQGACWLWHIFHKKQEY